MRTKITKELIKSCEVGSGIHGFNCDLCTCTMAQCLENLNEVHKELVEKEGNGIGE